MQGAKGVKFCPFHPGCASFFLWAVPAAKMMSKSGAGDPKTTKMSPNLTPAPPKVRQNASKSEPKCTLNKNRLSKNWREFCLCPTPGGAISGRVISSHILHSIDILNFTTTAPITCSGCAKAIHTLHYATLHYTTLH